MAYTVLAIPVAAPAAVVFVFDAALSPLTNRTPAMMTVSANMKQTRANTTAAYPVAASLIASTRLVCFFALMRGILSLPRLSMYAGLVSCTYGCIMLEPLNHEISHAGSAHDESVARVVSCDIPSSPAGVEHG